MPYASPAKRAMCARRACKRYYRRYHNKELERAARYRQANRKAVSQRQQEYIKRKLAKDPSHRVRMICQIHWKARCRRKGVYRSKGFLALLGMPWPEFAARLERQLKRRGWQWTDFGSKFWIDHRLPVCAFDLKKAEERAMCTHWSNLQVLPASWNRAKNGYFSKDDLHAYKTMWKTLYGPRRRKSGAETPF
jgi:hypothetical protein